MAGLTLACGGAPSGTPEATRPPIDLSHRLSGHAALRGTVRPAKARGLLDGLSARAPGFAVLRDRGLLAGLSPRILGALKLADEGPLWWSVTAGGAADAIRTGEDVQKLVETPEVFALSAWMKEHPLPPAWLHVQVVGPRAEPAAARPLDAVLAEWTGAVQIARPDSPPETVATLLDVDTARAAATLASLRGGPRGPQMQLVRLWEAELPTLMRVRTWPDRVEVDWIQDQDLGPGALATALERLMEAEREGAASQAPTRATPLPRDAVLTVDLDHERWGTLLRMLGELSVLHVALTEEALTTSRPDLVRIGRAAARAPARLFAEGGALFDDSRLVLRADAERLRLSLQARYEVQGRDLASLTGGAVPFAHRAVAGGQAITVSVAPPPDREALQRLPEPEQVLSLSLAEIARCGVVCAPALWLSLPGHLKDPLKALGSVLPELEALSPGLAATRGAVVRFKPESPLPLAATLAYAAPARAARAAWATPPERFEVSWRAMPGGQAEVATVANDPSLKASLERLGLAAGNTDAALARLSWPLSPATSGAFSAVEGALTFGPEAMEISVSLPLRPLAPPSAPSAAAPR